MFTYEIAHDDRIILIWQPSDTHGYKNPIGKLLVSWRETHLMLIKCHQFKFKATCGNIALDSIELSAS